MTEIQGYAEACQTRDRNTTIRSKKLRHLNQYVEGTQYEGKPDWFTADTAPLWDRAPCVVYPIVKCAIDSNCDLLLGEGRFATVRVEGLTGTEADKFEKAISHIVRQSRLKAAAREVFAAGQGCGSACAIFGVRGNRLCIDTVLAEWCKPELGPEGEVLSLEIRYAYLEITKDSQGNEKYVCKLYRRTVDKTHDITYEPTLAKEDGTEPVWRKALEVQHGLGFCPVIWFAHLRGCQVVNDFDGKAIHEHLTDEIRALDFTLSQRHRAALYAGDPQWVEIGVELGYNPAPGGRQPELGASLTGRPGEKATGAWTSQPAQAPARKKSPGIVWQYPGADASKTKVDLITLPGDALQAVDDHAKDLRAKIAEGLGVVFIDLEALPNESRLSGKALESSKGRQLDRVNYYRSDFGDHFLLPALGMLIRIAIKKEIKFDGLDIVAAQTRKTIWSWHSPAIDLIWGDYFQPSGEEEFYLMQSAEKAQLAGIATRKVLVEKLKGVLGIRDVEAYMSELDKEREENQKAEVDAEVQVAKASKPAVTPAAKAK